MTDGVTLHLGEAERVLPTLPADSADALVTDPPGGINFMGLEFDSDRGGRDRWVGWLSGILTESLRVCRPGAVGLVWAIPRTSHWTALAIEEAGWVIEDRIAHLFGTGFPKHKSKLKPACEDWWVCRKPGPKWLGVEECRVLAPGGLASGGSPNGHRNACYMSGDGDVRAERAAEHPAGRWPANVTHDGSPEVLEAFAEAGERGGGFGVRGKGGDVYHGRANRSLDRVTGQTVGHGDTGTAARFFYCAKASKADRGEGNKHPTVKNTALMRWLVRLACPLGGTVLDPFMGSGSTGVACVGTGRLFVGVEKDAASYETARRRLADAAGPLFADPA